MSLLHIRRMNEGSKRRRFALWLDTGRWKNLLRDRERPWRTAIGAGLGAFIGATPVLGLHTWIAAGVGAITPLPTLSVLAGSNLSNPLTFVPLTWLEIRIGQILLGSSQALTRSDFSAEMLGRYWLDAWVGFLVVGPALGLLTMFGLRAALAWKARAWST